jgi:hypothetical protein
MCINGSEFLSRDFDDSVDSPKIGAEVPDKQRGCYYVVDCTIYVLTHKSFHRYKIVIMLKSFLPIALSKQQVSSMPSSPPMNCS